MAAVRLAVILPTQTFKHQVLGEEDIKITLSYIIGFNKCTLTLGQAYFKSRAYKNTRTAVKKTELLNNTTFLGKLRKYNELLSARVFTKLFFEGIGAGIIQLADARTGRALPVPISINEELYNDRFKVIIPFAGQAIKWEVVFNTLKHNFPPDFCFDDESFLADPDIDEIEKDVPSLANWELQDETALLQVINELLLLYKKHQISLLNDYSRLQFEYSSLIGEMNLKEEDVEVLVGCSSSKKSRGYVNPVHFLIRLDVNFDTLPPPPGLQNYGKDAACLLVTFCSPEGSRISPELFLSPNVERALGISHAMVIPPFPSRSCLMDYVPVVTNLLKNRIEVVALVHQKKKDYFAAFFHKVRNGLLEQETVTASRASFLLERRDFHFLLHVSLPQDFPKDRPVFTFQSVYHASYGKPYQDIAENYPYSPRWSVQDMVSRAYDHIVDFVEGFQRASINSCSQI